MTKKNPSRVRILMMPYQEDENSDPVGYSGPATVLTGLPRTIRRHELRLIVPLADTTIYEMEKRGDTPRKVPSAWTVGDVCRAHALRQSSSDT